MRKKQGMRQVGGRRQSPATSGYVSLSFIGRRPTTAATCVCSPLAGAAAGRPPIIDDDPSIHPPAATFDRATPTPKRFRWRSIARADAKRNRSTLYALLLRTDRLLDVANVYMILILPVSSTMHKQRTIESSSRWENVL